MSERRSKSRKKKELPDSEEEVIKPHKEEYAIAKYLRQKLPPKKTSLLGHKVDYFIASKAIDCLLDSRWAIKSSKSEVYFASRESIVKFMDKMLRHKFFHRAKKIVVSKKKKDGEESAAEAVREKESKKSKPTKEEVEEKSEDKKSDAPKADDKADNKRETEGSDKKKEKKKIKLDMHLEQLYIDGNEVYVWIYDPIPMRTWIFGILMVAGAVLVCLFPLWPQIIRHYIYYLSVAAAFFLVFIIGLAILRLIVFVLIWLITFGKHHLWILPNLTEDVGFFESFWPLYKYEYKGAKRSKDKEKLKEKKDITEGDKEKETAEKTDSSSDQDKKVDLSEAEDRDSEECDKASSKADNGFELLDAEEAADPFQKKNE